mgnify:CR=1 FL=1
MISDIRKNRFRSGTAAEDVPDDNKRVQTKVTGTMIGRIVQSLSGRDADRLFVIVAELDGEHVAVADGRLRKCVNPKKKKLKHLEVTDFISEFVKNRLETLGKVTNQELRNALAEYLNR